MSASADPTISTALGRSEAILWPAAVAATRQRALDSVARARSVGPHFFGNFIGISGRPAIDGCACLELAVEPDAAPGGQISATAVATVADLTMTAAIRDRVGRQNRLGTITLVVHHLQPVVRGPVRTEAVATRVELDEKRGFARCEVRDRAGTLVAVSDGWFVAMPVARGQRLGPVAWELPPDTPVPPVPETELQPDERSAVEACAAAADRAATAGTSVVDELLAMAWTATVEGGVRGELGVGLQHVNRGGHVQGGVLYGAAALGAKRVVAEGMQLAEGHVSFLAPADGRTLVVESSVLRHGGRTSFAESRLTVDDRLVATGMFTLHRPAQSTGPTGRRDS